MNKPSKQPVIPKVHNEKFAAKKMAELMHQRVKMKPTKGGSRGR